MSPDEFELLVRDFLASHGGAEHLPNLKVQHRSVRAGPVSSGEYEIDVTAEFDAFGGAKLVVLAECKRYSEPVKRDVVLALKAKRDALAAHKAMLFSTSGFQSGAVEYARAQGIALVTVEEPQRSAPVLAAPRRRPRGDGVIFETRFKYVAHRLEGVEYEYDAFLADSGRPVEDSWFPMMREYRVFPPWLVGLIAVLPVLYWLIRLIWWGLRQTLIKM